MQNKIKPVDLLTDQFQQLKNLSVNKIHNNSSQNERNESFGAIIVNVSKILHENSAYLGIFAFYEANRLTSSQFLGVCRSFVKTLNQVSHLELCGNQMEWFVAEMKGSSLSQDTKLIVNNFSHALTHLDLSGNLIKTFPLECLSMPLKYLNLQNNHLSSLDNLESLIFKNNKESSKIQRTLVELNLSKNLIQKVPFQVITIFFSELTHLDIGENPIVSFELRTLTSQPRSAHLFGSVSNKDNSDEDFSKFISTFSKVSHLILTSLDASLLEKTIERKKSSQTKQSSLFNFYKKKELETLSSSGTFFPLEILSLHHLQVLDLSKNKHLPFHELEKIESPILMNIVNINLSECFLVGSVNKLLRFASKTNLQILDLSYNNFSHVDIHEFSSLKSLNLTMNTELLSNDENIYHILQNCNKEMEHLILQRIHQEEIGFLDTFYPSSIKKNKLDETTIGEFLSRLNDLKSLTLSGCFIKKCPSQLNGLHHSHLTALDLSFNEISEIPSSLMTLDSLTTLDLSHNDISLINVDDLGIIQLRNLTILNLSHNNLSQLPVKFIISLPTIQTISLEYNAELLKSIPQEVTEEFNKWSNEHSKVIFRRILIEPSLVINGLYLSGNASAQSKHQMKRLGITHVLNVAEGLTTPFPFDFIYKKVELEDTLEQDLFPHLDECVDFIEEALKNHKTVLVHCKAGVSRSASMVIAYIMKKYNQSYENALEFVKERRPQVCPNTAFIHQLMRYEQKLRMESQGSAYPSSNKLDFNSTM
ncbi:hypothetical protein C9374_013409 [Naegleria lovaniensis]|uniref:Uncharacterized protein n=1 Tax=Naegleria lovaniensis TaxID=51637 RepID=A0AA88H1A8_NAELO|nr:uncharacterized protein C9374_013409 [Naegleria lovaniensis]KAG2391924.1 hypothetical protein C9374_013409 [Naegleria lovaniensis]